MTPYFVHDGTYLLRHGTAPEAQIDTLAGEGEVVEAGDLVPTPCPGAGYRWHIIRQCWVDCRTDAERAQAAGFDIQKARYAAYPPLADLADALVHQSQGDSAPLSAYLAACAAVKARFPKVK